MALQCKCLGLSLYLASKNETGLEDSMQKQENRLLEISEGWVGEHEFMCSHLAIAFSEGLCQSHCPAVNLLTKERGMNKWFFCFPLDVLHEQTIEDLA